jgi:hypothetical protein
LNGVYEDVVVQAEKMKSTIKILTIILLIGIYSCEFKNDRQEYAEMLIEKVETFKETNNQLKKCEENFITFNSNSITTN